MSKLKSLIIVESPTKAKKIQDILGDKYIVLSSYGHICDLAKGGSNGIGIDIKNNFKPRYVMSKDKISVIEGFLKQLPEVDQILLASDLDREGEAISFHLNEYLKSSGKPIKRLTFKEITKKGIQEGLKNLREIDLDLVRSQEARRILDRIVGFMVSPFLINFYGKGESLSSGRVQSVAARMIVDREQEIEAFKPEEYWNIYSNFKNDKKELFSSKLEMKIKNKNEADFAFNKIKTLNDFYVKSVKKTIKKVKPEPPLTTIKLQQYMAKRYNVSADQTMLAAQSLYENGLCTYIRTDSTRISDEAIQEVRGWIKENKFDVPKQINIYIAKNSQADAHECIRPTEISLTPEKFFGSELEKQTYDTIWKFFVASQMNPAEWSNVNILITSKTNQKIIFSSSGKTLEYKGYLEIFNFNSENKNNLPLLQENEKVFIIVDSLKQEQKFTQPLPRFNDYSLLKELETKKIGRPATTAEIIKKISDRKYVEKRNTTFYPTDLGKKINGILKNYFKYMDYDFSSQLETQLDLIAEGKLDNKEMLKMFYEEFKPKLDKAYIDNGGDICPKCGSPMVFREKNGSKFLGCINYSKGCYSTKQIQVAV